jgi:transitional endoplasmic reticulum ATPase
MKQFQPRPHKSIQPRKQRSRSQQIQANTESGQQVPHMAGSSQPQPLLCIGRPIDAGDSLLHNPNDAYLNWLRVIRLRLVKLGHAFGVLRDDDTFLKLTDSLCLENATEFVAQSGLNPFLESLQYLESQWSQALEGPYFYTPAINHNLAMVRDCAQLDDTELSVLGLAILFHTEPSLSACANLLGHWRGSQVARLFSALLNFDADDIERALSVNGRLHRSSLLTIDMRGEGDIASRLDMLNMSFPHRMLKQQPDVYSIVRGLVSPAPPAQLSLEDFEHVQPLQGTLAYLDQALKTGMTGVNVLLYGPPGTGKTQLSLLIGQQLGRPVLSVASTDVSGDPMSPIGRTRMYRLAQSVFGPSRPIVLFDECEEIFVRQPVFTDEDQPVVASKSWLNQVLESNPAPTLWVCNHIDGMDPAVLRRFDICLHIQAGSQRHRQLQLTKSCGTWLDQHSVQHISQHPGVTPALIDQAAHVISTLGQQLGESGRAAFAHQLLQSKLKVAGHRRLDSFKAPGNEFRPEWVNTTAHLPSLVEGLRATRDARICLYGPPGTGKTAFGHWLAQELDMPHILCKASDVLGPHVGETERSIARLFERAEQESALLQIDEVDSLLRERQDMKQSWEVSLVNEMLAQMDGYSGVFIASTNLVDTLDEAALRRFDLTLKFDCLRPDQATDLFRQTCWTLLQQHPEDALLAECKPNDGWTAGDFEQVMRRARLQRVEGCRQVLELVKQASCARTRTRVGTMGFV